MQYLKIIKFLFFGVLTVEDWWKIYHCSFQCSGENVNSFFFCSSTFFRLKVGGNSIISWSPAGENVNRFFPVLRFFVGRRWMKTLLLLLSVESVKLWLVFSAPRYFFSVEEELKLFYSMLYSWKKIFIFMLPSVLSVEDVWQPWRNDVRRGHVKYIKAILLIQNSAVLLPVTTNRNPTYFTGTNRRS